MPTSHTTLTDSELWDLIEQTNKQYEEYLQISKVLDPIGNLEPEEETTDPPRSWSHPLTLVIRREPE
jgi:hypothetical protein